MPPRVDDAASAVLADAAVIASVLGPGASTPTRELFRTADWAAGPLGRPSSWSDALRVTVGTVVTSRFPMVLMAGPRLVMVYNDAYAPMLGARHPAAMGRPLAQVWSDVWPTIGPMIAEVSSSGEANYFEDLMLVMTRHGFDEETYFTFSYSPVREADGSVVGVLDTAIETTGRVLANRRLQVVQRLSELATGTVTTLEDAGRRVVSVLADQREDIPVAGIYLLDDPADQGSSLRLTAGSGMTGGDGLSAQADAWLRTTLQEGLQVATGQEGAWSGLAAAPEAVGGGDVHTLVAVPLTPPGRPTTGVLVAGVSPHLRLDSSYRTFLELTAGQVAAVLGAAADHLQERRAADSTRVLAESLQRSMLTEPVQPDHLELATRYLPAARHAEVGGDWYDSFLAQDGATWLVVGDVAGHDVDAAAVMGQVRNLLRGVAYTRQVSPAQVLTALDEAMAGLGVSSLVTVVALRIEQVPADRARGVRHVRWSNAGHPSPVHVPAGGRPTVLETTPETLLGADAGTPRTDHEIDLQPGDTVLIYTDGLTERRRHDLDTGTRWLLDTLAEHGTSPLEDLCDALVAAVADDAEDDVALLALRAHPEDAPRPPEAGPHRLPERHPAT